MQLLIPLQMSKGYAAHCGDEAGNSGSFFGLNRGFRHPFILAEDTGLAFESLQGNHASPRGRGTWCPFHLRQQTQGPSHIPIAERSLLLKCLWEVGIPLESKPGNQLSSRDDLGYMELFLHCCAELGVPLDW